MKTIPIISHYQQDSTSLTRCLRLEKTRTNTSDDLVYAYTALEQPLTVDGIVYQPGLDTTNLVTQSGLQVDNLEVTILPDAEDTPLLADLLAGFWDNAEFTIFEVNFRNPAAGVNVLARGRTGIAKANRSSWTIEFRSLKQALQQPLVMVTTKICRARFCDYPSPVPGALCRLDPSEWMVVGEVTDSFDNGRTFVDSSRIEGGSEFPDWFKNGIVEFLSGDNAGYSRRVKDYDSGEFEMTDPFPYPIQEGDEYQAIAGCQHRLIEDCKDRFDNVLNFQAEPHIVGIDGITATPEVNV